MYTTITDLLCERDTRENKRFSAHWDRQHCESVVYSGHGMAVDW